MVDSETVSRLAAAVDTGDLAAAKELAVLGREEDNRPQLSKALQPLVAYIERTDDKASATDALRAIGNACVDNDDNRQLLLDLGGCRAVADCLRWAANTHTDDETFLAVASAVVLNTSSECAPVQNAYVAEGCLPLLLAQCSTTAPSQPRCMAVRAVDALVETEQGRAELCKHQGVLTLLEVALDGNEENEDAAEQATSTLSGLFEEDDTVREHAYKTKEVHDRLLEQAQSHALPAKLLALMICNDECLAEISASPAELGRLEEVFISCCESSEVPIRAAGALGIGNLARSDANCAHLVGTRALEVLYGQLASTNALEIHAVLSAVRNLAIAKSVRPQLVRDGLIARIVTHAESLHGPIVSLLSCILKSLTSDSAEACRLVVTDAGSLELLARLCGADHEGTSAEAARAVANIVKRSDDKQQAISALRDAGCLAPLFGLLSSKHRVLQNEALVACAVVCASAQGEKVPEVNEDTLSSINTIAHDTSVPPEMRSNASVLLQMLSSAGYSIPSADAAQKAGGGEGRAIHDHGP